MNDAHDTQPAHYAVVPQPPPPALEIDPLDPTVFVRACAAFDTATRVAKAMLRRRRTDKQAEMNPD